MAQKKPKESPACALPPSWLSAWPYRHTCSGLTAQVLDDLGKTSRVNDSRSKEAYRGLVKLPRLVFRRLFWRDKRHKFFPTALPVTQVAGGRSSPSPACGDPGHGDGL